MHPSSPHISTFDVMHIIFTRFPLESAYGGAEVQTLSLMDGFKKRGHEVTFLGSCPVLLDWIPELHLKKHELHLGNPPVTIWGVVSFLWRQFFMKRKLIHALHRDLQVTKHKPQAIFMLSLSEKLLLTPWAVKHGIKVFWIEHDRIERWLTKNPWLPRLRNFSKRVTTICVSELSRKMYIDLGWDPRKIIAIPNGIDKKRLGSGKSACPAGRSLRIGCVARLSHDKGIDLLIKALADIPTVHLTIVGRGSDAQSLVNMIDQANAQHHGEYLCLHSFVEDLGAFYRSLDLLILPSREHDPFGLVAAEAMLCGLPVIVTNVCGIASYLRDGIDALIATPNSVSALREAITIVRDPDFRSRIAQEGQKTAREKFTLQKMLDAYEKLL